MSEITNIQFYNTDVSGRTSALSQGELAVNIPDKLLVVGNQNENQIRLNRFYPIAETRYEQTTQGITLPLDVAFIEIIGCGGGGGGGGGSSIKSSTLTTRSKGGNGGQGGQGGRIVFCIKTLGLTAGESKIDVNVGSGGAGGGSSSGTANDGGAGGDGSNSFVCKNNETIQQAYIVFYGGVGGAGGNRTATGVETDGEDPHSFIDGISRYHDDEPSITLSTLNTVYFGGQGRLGYGNANTSVNSNVYSNYFGGGGGGGGGGGWTSGGVGVTFQGGYGGAGTFYSNSVIENLAAPGYPGSDGVTGKYGGSGGGGGHGRINDSVNSNAGSALNGSGGGGGGGGAQRFQANITGSSGRGGTGGSGYVIIRWW